MVASHHIRPHAGFTQVRDQTLGNNKVIKSPAHVLCSAVPHEGPEGVFSRLFRVQLSEGINKSCISQLPEILPLRIGESRGFVAVTLGVG